MPNDPSPEAKSYHPAGTDAQSGGSPLYAQVRREVVARVAGGYWRPGDMLPSEQALAREFGVSQGTVRKALDALTAENLVVRRQGKGTFVARHNPERSLFHFFKVVADGGVRELPARSRILSCVRRRATREEAKLLTLEPGARVVHIDRIRDLGSRPAIVERIVLPGALFPDLGRPIASLPNTLYRLYEEKYGISVHQAVERVRAVAAEAADAAALGVKIGAPLLEIDRLASTLDRLTVEWRRSRVDTRYHHYLAELV